MRFRLTQEPTIRKPDPVASTARGRSRAATESGARIRAFTEEDVPSVVALFERCFGHHRWDSRAACEAYFREIFFNHPWRDLALPSLVAHEHGRVAGFYGVMPRPMRFRGRDIRVAAACTAMVDPGCSALIALELLKAQLAGQQDLTLADGATPRSLGIWRGIGGEAPLAYNLHWTRALRPARYLLSQHAARSTPRRILAVGARPLAALVDASAARLRTNGFLRRASELVEEPLDPAVMADDFPRLSRGKALCPVYDAHGLEWLLGQAAVRRGHGTLRARRVLDRERRPLGWYVYYLRREGPSELIQLVARGGAYERVLERLLADAWRHGASAMRGRLDPEHAATLSNRGCWLRWQGPAMLVHSRDPEIVDAIRHGDAFLSRLDGEWWMRFVST